MSVEEFIKGFRALRLEMPKISVAGYQNQNCPYGNAIYNSKNCYWCFDMDSSEACMYCGLVTRARFCVDSEDIWDSELCYEGFEIYNCYGCDYSRFLRNCSGCGFCFDCLNCRDCFGCVGLRRKNYHIFNEPYSPQEYTKRVHALKKLPHAEIEARVEKLREEYPHVALRQYQTENCFGDNIQNSKNCYFSFNCKGVYDGAYCSDVYTVYGDRNEDAYDCYFGVDHHSCYECIQLGDAWNCAYCHYCEHIRESEFCEACFNSQNLFGCSYIQRKEYLILNKPYPKEEWHKLTRQLKDSLKAAKSYSWALFE